MKSNRLELLAPAGSPEALDAAAGAGADAVYVGLKTFNARMRSANFTYSQLEGALRGLRRQKRKLYVTVNTVFEQREADRMYQLLKYLAGLGPDALIIQDFGLITMAREYFPGLKLHASTQMNIASARGVNLLSKHGVSRVVLARELSVPEIREIRARSGAELEVFVHGALCVSASGLCLFSSFLGGKSANRGMCTQACRRYYTRSDTGGRGYYFSPADLRLLSYLPELAHAGVTACKIEGRMKSAAYVGTVVAAYRAVIDALYEDRGEAGLAAAMENAAEILTRDFARAKTVFYNGPETGWLDPNQNGGTGIPLGKIRRVKHADGVKLGCVSGPGGSVTLAAGDFVRFHRADDTSRAAHKLLKATLSPASAYSKEKKEKEKKEEWWISIPEGFGAGDAAYLIQTTTRRFPPVIRPGNFKRAPGMDRAPELALWREKTEKTEKKAAPFPAGFYVGVSRVEDLYILQSDRPCAVMLAYTPKTAGALLRGNCLPFSPKEIILVLDPSFPQAREAALAEEIPALMERGYRQFVANNLGHLSYFRDRRVEVVAGPSLYVFNRWACAFVSKLGMESFISPLENNRQNLERTVEVRRRSLAFITVFSYPPLFRIRADLRTFYGFDRFSDAKGGRFVLTSPGEGSLVIPETPFSLVDKIPFLHEAGFRRFILDVSGVSLKKGEYRDLMRSARDACPIPDASRFNWKDGFYRDEEPRSDGKARLETE
ncbi:MAG: U32 family peptidase [Spirochaetaceae bacterium]|jgi:putative protease|nr:U32 family peptidase [Spirochaetaceae bacterium]